MGKSIARTFGMKRIQFMMMPMIYKMGVMMTMIAALTIISLKGLLIGKVSIFSSLILKKFNYRPALLRINTSLRISPRSQKIE